MLKRKKIDCRKYQHKKDRFLFWCARIWVPTLEHWYNSIKIHLDTSMVKFKQSDKRFLWSKLPLYLIYYQGQIQTKSKILLTVWAPIKGAQNKFMTLLILHYLRLVYLFWRHLIWAPKFKQFGKIKTYVFHINKILLSVTLCSKFHIDLNHNNKVNRTKDYRSFLTFLHFQQ